MSARLGLSAGALDDVLIEPMAKENLEAVIAIENAVYAFPWTLRNFSDSLDAGYRAWILKPRVKPGFAEECSGLIGYCVLMFAADEAHLLNLSVARSRQARGYGLCLLEHAARVAREHTAQSILLEVRISNRRAIGIYNRFGFNRIGIRRGYYPCSAADRDVREDALVMRLELW